jgi:hypothetical protein
MAADILNSANPPLTLSWLAYRMLVTLLLCMQCKHQVAAQICDALGTYELQLVSDEVLAYELACMLPAHQPD